MKITWTDKEIIIDGEGANVPVDMPPDIHCPFPLTVTGFFTPAPPADTL